MCRRVLACLLAGSVAWPAVLHAQSLPERFGYCQLNDGDPVMLYVSPVFEVDIPAGRKPERLQQDARGFAEAVRAQAAIAPESKAHCLYTADGEQMRKEHSRMRIAFKLGGGPNPYRAVEWSPSPLPAQAAAHEIPDIDALDPAVLTMLETDAFFTLPKGNGTSIEHAGARRHRIEINGVVSYTPVQSRFAARRSEGNQCTVEQHVIAGEGSTALTTDSRGPAWAGVLPLATGVRMASEYIQAESRIIARGIEHEGAMFPLREGMTSTLRVRADKVDGDVISPLLQEFTCTVGTTAAASGVIPGASGEATALRCELRYPDISPAFVVPLVYHWFADAGCFVQDPTQPDG